MRAVWVLGMGLVLAAPAGAESIQVARCADPLAVTLIEQREGTRIERDFIGCGQGPVALEWPEGMPGGYRASQFEDARYTDVSARVAEGKIALAFKTRDGARHQLALAFDERHVVPDSNIEVMARHLPGGPWVSVRADGSTHDIARALGKALGQGVRDLDVLQVQPMRLNFQMIEPATVWNLVGDIGQAWALIDAKGVRFWRPGMEAPSPDPRLRMAQSSGEAAPTIVEIRALQGRADTECAAASAACIDLHTQILALAAPPHHPYPTDHLASSLALLRAHHAAGQEALAQAQSQALARELGRAEYRAAQSTAELLETLTTLVEVEADTAALALLPEIEKTLAAMPPQRVRISTLRADALRLALHADAADAVARWQQLAERYFDFEVEADYQVEEEDYDLTQLDAAPISLDAADAMRPALRLAATRVADALEAKGADLPRASVLITALHLTDDGAPRARLRMQLAQSLLRLRETSSALRAVQGIECEADSPACDFRRRYEAALLLVQDGPEAAHAVLSKAAQAAAGCADYDQAFVAMLRGESTDMPAAAADCASEDALPALVLQALPRTPNPWQQQLAAEALSLRAASDPALKPAALRAIEVALASNPEAKARFEHLRAQLDEARP